MTAIGATSPKAAPGDKGGDARVGKDALSFNAKDYGVKGDGVTMDTAAINALYTTVRAAAGAKAVFPPGTYVIDGPIYPDGVTTSAYGVTFKVKAGTTQNYAAVQIASACTILGLTIDLNKPNTTNSGNLDSGMGVYVMHGTAWQDVTLRDLTIKNGWQIGIRLATEYAGTDPALIPNAAGLVANCTITNCRFGIWNLQTSGVSLVSNQITDITEDGILDNLTNNTLIQGNTIRDAGGHGIVVAYSARTRISGNTTESCLGGGITIGGGSTTLPGAIEFAIDGNTSTGNQHGIWIDTTKEGALTTPVVCNGVISGNVCSVNTTHGIYLHNAKTITVNGNAIHGNAYAGILGDSFGASISGNTITENYIGLYLAGTVAGYGSHEIGPNVITDNTYSNYTFDSMGAVSTTLTLS